jgi:hypothetical protein
MNEQLFKVKIVQIIAILLFSLCTFPLFAQTKVITQIDNNLYKYRAYQEDGSIHQKGMYFESDGKLLIHDYWKDSFGNKALYKKGKLVWYKPKGDRKWSGDEIRIKQLEAKLEDLSQKVTSRD